MSRWTVSAVSVSGASCSGTDGGWSTRDPGAETAAGGRARSEGVVWRGAPPGVASGCGRGGGVNRLWYTNSTRNDRKTANKTLFSMYLHGPVDGAVGHRVVAGLAERVTAAEPLDAQPAALQQAVPPDGLRCVLGTGRHEPARTRKQWGKKDFVDTNQDERPARADAGPPNRLAPALG